MCVVYLPSGRPVKDLPLQTVKLCSQINSCGIEWECLAILFLLQTICSTDLSVLDK